MPRGGVCDQDGELRPDDAVLIGRYIESDPLDRGLAEAQLVDHGVSVWALMAHLGAVDGDIERAAASYEIGPEAVEAARRYFCIDRPLIDARITLNRSSSQR